MSGFAGVSVAAGDGFGAHVENSQGEHSGFCIPAFAASSQS
jgi:hypothetical protein